ncbi:MAG: ABC transporter permease [Victivallaceae bacterium]|jgi:peptide/nickel transport system permease protein
MMDKPINNNTTDISYAAAAWRRFKSDSLAVTGLTGIVLMVSIALLAPFIANGRPLMIYRAGTLSFPFLYFIFSPDSIESLVEKVFNYFLLLTPLLCVVFILFRNNSKAFRIAGCCAIILLAIPFFMFSPRVDKKDWRTDVQSLKSGEYTLFALVPFGPYELIGAPYEKPSARHWLGTDQIGRDVMARMVYGSRVSLAVGIFATLLELVIGTMIGLFAGYFRGKLDIVLMRLVEIIICFPTFLLLLILMSMMITWKFEQSILVVIGVIGLTGWIGLCQLVRGEVLKNRALPYVQSCEATGLPVWRIMLFHLLPNISGPILITFSFGVAGAILAESGLSFLGFGVQAPTASWGGLLRQAFDDPFAYWHLTLCPGVALFVAVCAFNFTGEGLRKVFDPRG